VNQIVRVFLTCALAGGTISIAAAQGTVPAPAVAPLAYAEVGHAMQLQAAGDDSAAVQSYTAAVTALNVVVTQHLEPDAGKSARDHMAYSVVQLAVLQRGKIDSHRYLSYAYDIEKQYLGYETVRADELFASGQFSDAFAVWRAFAVRAGYDRQPGRNRLMYDALDAAVRGRYNTAAASLRAAIRIPFRFGKSEPLFVLGEVERARHRDREAISIFWQAVSERPEMVKFGLWGPQICAAGAVAREAKSVSAAR